MEINSQNSSLHWWWMPMILFTIFNCKKSDLEKDSYFVSETIKNTTVYNNIISDTLLSDKDLKEFKMNVIKKGDTYSFGRISIHLDENSQYSELLKYSLIMANKHHKGDGFSEAFMCIVAINNNNSYTDIKDFANINEKAKGEAIEYLKKGVSINDINCTSMLQEIYRNGIGVKKDIKKADELKKDIEKM